MANVAYNHPDYSKHLSKWQKCRHAIDGEDAVKAGGEVYLPRLTQQNDQEYLAYLNRGCYFGASGRTVKGLVGAVNRKPAQVNFPSSQKDLLQDLSPDGEPLELISQQVLEEVISVGRVGVLVDAPAEGDGNPYVTIYYAENVINWREEMLPDAEGLMKKRLTLVVLLEDAYVDDENDSYVSYHQQRFRVLTLNDDGKGYTVQVFTQDERPKNAKAEDVDTFTLLEEYEPKGRGGVAIGEIPFTFINPNGTGCEVDKPPLLDLVNVNLSHWRSSCDLEHGLHFTALPTPWAVGFQVKGALFIGSSKAWVSEEPTGRCGFLEFSGAGLSAIVTRMEAKEQYMAVLGGRLLEEKSANPESGVAISLRTAGEKSVLATIARSCSEGLTKILKWVCEWANAGDSSKVSFLFNQDYNTSVLDGRSLTAFLAALQAGKISFEAWFTLLKQANVYDEEWTLKDEIAAIEQGGPAPAAGTVVPPNGQMPASGPPNVTTGQPTPTPKPAGKVPSQFQKKQPAQ